MSFRPANAISLDDLTAREAENVIYESEFTIMFHIFISLATACLGWIFMLKPLMSRKKLIFGITSLFWLFLIPLLVVLSGALTDSVMAREDENNSLLFIYLKFFSVWASALFLIGFILYGDSKNMSKTRTWVFGILLVGNIIEAAQEQIRNKRTGNEIVDIVNGSFGFILGILVIISLYYSNGVNVVKNKDQVFLNLPLDTFFILAYTFWNILFRSYLLENSGTLLFVVVSLFLPLFLHFMGIGSWFQNRVFTLFFYMLVMIGFSKGQGRIFPVYNEQGYIEEPDSKSPLSYIQGEEWYKVVLLILTGLCLIGSVYTIFKNRK